MKKLSTLLILSLSLSQISVQAQTLTTFAGSSAGYNTGSGTTAQFNRPYGIAFDGGGAVVLTDQNNYRVRKIFSDGSTGLLAGSGVAGNINGTGAAAQFSGLAGVARDGFNNTYVTDVNFNTIKKITSSGVVTTVAGGTEGNADGIGAAAQFNRPYGLTSDINGNLYVSDTYNHRIRKISAAGVVTTLAGSTQGYADGTGTAAQFNHPFGIAVDGAGNVYVGENCRIRKITPAGVVTTFAGGTPGFANGNGTAAQFQNGINGIATDAAGNLFVADTYNYRIRKITATGEVTTYAGLGYSGTTDGDVSVGTFSEITGIAVGSTGIVYIVDHGNHRIRRIMPPTVPLISSNISHTVSGNTAGIFYSINAGNSLTSSVIKYGLSSGNLSSQATGFTASGNTLTTETITIAGLLPLTTYYYQIEATNSVGTATSSIGSFTTGQAPVQELITAYNFDNSYNNINGNTPFGTNAGTSFTTDRHGIANRALDINNTGTTATITGLPYGNSPRTIAFWAKTNVMRADYNMSFSYGQPSNGSSNGGSFNSNSASYLGYSNNFSTASTFSEGIWYFFTYTYDGTTSKIYRNGVQIGSLAMSWNTLNNSNIFRLGVGVGGELWFNGAIDDLKIYNYVVSDTQIANLYATNTLPVELVSYTANAQNGSALLNWQTASETNNSHFIIKRSNDGTHFTPLATIPAKAPSGANYSYTDHSPSNGSNYYQLSQVDLDGTTKTIGLKTVRFTLDDNLFRLYPNPATDQVKISFEVGTYGEIEIFSISGQMLISSKVLPNEYEKHMDISKLPKGTYLLKLSGKKNISTQKIIKK